jgi:UDP-3-O-[3-hydroxymyristoyl] glucosamine N-acyltransferase
LSEAGEGSLCFLSNRKYLSTLKKLKALAVITQPGWVQESDSVTYVVVSNPQASFAKLARLFLPSAQTPGVHPTACLGENVYLGPDVSVGPYCVVSNNVKIGKGTVLFPYVYLGEGVRIGEHCQIHPRVTVYPQVSIGDRVKIFSGTVLGSTGFGLYSSKENSDYSEMPHIGSLTIENDVRIGANCTVDRATLGTTLLKSGCKIDNLVHIGHNCTVGKNVILCAQVGLSGSVRLGEGVILGGQAGVADGVKIGEKAKLLAQSGTSTDLKENETYFLSPAIPWKQSLNLIRFQRKLSQMYQRIVNLESKVGSQERENNEIK